MDRIVNVGIIGCGGIANGKHMPSLKSVPNVRMVAFCDIILEKAEKAAREYGTPDAKVYTDYKELLKAPSIEVVHVLTPNLEHADISIDALHAGKHVMCEKPMAKTAADARRMVAAATTEAHNWIRAIVDDTDPVVLPEQACVVSEILEAIYTSSKTGKAVYFE